MIIVHYTNSRINFAVVGLPKSRVAKTFPLDGSIPGPEILLYGKSTSDALNMHSFVLIHIPLKIWESPYDRPLSGSF